MEITSSFTAYIAGKYGAGLLVGAASADGVHITRCDFAANVPEATQQAIQNEASTYVAPPAPSLQGFIDAVRTEPTFNAQIRIGLAPFVSVLALDDATIKQTWADLVSEYGGTWLTAAVQQTVLNYQAQFNLPAFQ